MIIHKWKTFKTVDSLPRSGRPSNFVPKNTKTQASVQYTPHINCQARWWRAYDLDLFRSYKTWAPVIESTVNSSVYRSIQVSNMRPCMQQLKLGWNWVMQQGNDTKHSSKSTTERLKNKSIKTARWPRKSPDLTWLKWYGWDHKSTLTNIHNPQWTEATL